MTPRKPLGRFVHVESGKPCHISELKKNCWVSVGNVYGVRFMGPFLAIAGDCLVDFPNGRCSLIRSKKRYLDFRKEE